MGAWADSLFTVLMSWVRALVNGIWALFSSDHTTILEFLGKNWLMIAAALIAAGLVIDWLVWLVRWQPYHLWARRLRRLLRIPEPEDDEEEAPRRKATAARYPSMRRESAYQPEPEHEPAEETDDGSDWMPLERPDTSEAQQVMAQADSVPDEVLGAYPGMRYGAVDAAAPRADETMRYAAVHAEGPGAEEVARRRGEIDAWQRQMQEDARRQAEAERARREQEAYEAEQARLAQEEYERQLAEYERQKAQYALDLAEYERQKAAYDAQMAAQQTAQWQAVSTQEDPDPSHRRRSAQADAGVAEDVTGVPDAGKAGSKGAKPRRDSGMVSRMARMLEPENEEIAGVRALPPRVSVSEAYKPAKKPQQQGRRRR